MVAVTPAAPEHVDVLAELADEMDRFYGATELEPHGARRRLINRALFGDPPSAYALLAWQDDLPAGFAAYSFLWPAANLTRSVFLKEQYVIEAARGAGAGKALMRRLAEIVIEHDCSRLEWHAERSNLDAQAFYAQLGVPVRDSKLFYRAHGGTLRELAGRSA